MVKELSYLTKFRLSRMLAWITILRLGVGVLFTDCEALLEFEFPEDVVLAVSQLDDELHTVD